MATTTETLLARIKRDITMPANEILLEDADILAIADDVMRSQMVPLLLSLRQEYFLTSSTTPLVAGQNSYAIPYRAIGRTLRDFKLEDATGTVRSLSLIPIEDEHRLVSAGAPYSFYFKGDKVILLPTPTSTVSTLIFWWDLAPNDLVVPTAAAQVSSVSGDTVTFLTVPQTFIAGVTLDFIQGQSGNSLLAMDKAITSVAGTQVTFTTGDVPTTLVAGDWVALSQQSPVVQLPNEVLPLFQAWTEQGCLKAIGDYEGAKALVTNDLERNVKLMMQPRIQGEPSIIMNRNGLLRGRHFSPRRGYLIY